MTVAAHKLKSSARAIGAGGLSDQWQIVETAGKGGELRDCSGSRGDGIMRGDLKVAPMMHMKAPPRGNPTEGSGFSQVKR
jgi:hypothetical protein